MTESRFGEGERRENSPRGEGELPTLRVFDSKGREVFWAEVAKEMLVEFFEAAQRPGEHTIALRLTTKNASQWLLDENAETWTDETHQDFAPRHGGNFG